MKNYFPHPTVDAAALGSIALSMLDYAPRVAACFAIAWYLYLFSTPTVALLQRLVKRLFG